MQQHDEEEGYEIQVSPEFWEMALQDENSTKDTIYSLLETISRQQKYIDKLLDEKEFEHINFKMYCTPNHYRDMMLQYQTYNKFAKFTPGVSMFF